MLPELGHFALILALLLAGLQAFFGIAGPALGRDRWTAEPSELDTFELTEAGLAYVASFAPD